MNGGVGRRVLLGVAPWLGVIALWYAVRWSGFVNVALVPAPHQVAAKFVDLLLHEGLLFDIYASTRRVLLGVILGIAVAVPVGEAARVDLVDHGLTPPAGVVAEDGGRVRLGEVLCQEDVSFRCCAWRMPYLMAPCVRPDITQRCVNR